jgi:hypothetical protein
MHCTDHHEDESANRLGSHERDFTPIGSKSGSRFRAMAHISNRDMGHPILWLRPDVGHPAHISSMSKILQSAGPVGAGAGIDRRVAGCFSGERSSTCPIRLMFLAVHRGSCRD